MAKNEDLAEVVHRERQLLDPTIRGSGQRVHELLHPDFIEYGASGRTWDRTTVSVALSADPRVSGTGTDFLAVALADNIVLLTYRIRGYGWISP
ncbi:nuclear transport factor 2 family protein [Ferrimicrobium sp.]|jgi:ribonuclease HI|uniref:DUF4440 domain-containing protein n=1 Tax=Ferrimicrobium acidiphilum TaxID=121039 RepID=A0ABV3Y2M9_9ACTN|nr:nuclear transport factor 2 family protein [Ferrimicrobium sp.]